MNKNYFFVGVGGLILGLIIGFSAANTINRNAFTQQTAPPNPAVQNAPFSSTQPSSAVQPNENEMLAEVNQTLEKARNEPENFEAQAKAAEMYAQIQRFDKAAEFYEKANKIKPEDYQTMVNLGNTYFDLKQYETAEKWYLLALEKNPDDSNVRTDLGVTFVERSNPDLDRAIKEFQTSMQKNPRHEPTVYNLGIAYFKKGNTEEANKIVRQLEEINPQSTLAGRLKQIINK